MTIEDFVSRLDKASKTSNGWQARCPAHDDKDPSLHVSQGADGRILVHCHAGCSNDAICSKLNIKTADLFSKNGKPRKIVATYDYTDERGELLYQAVRYDPKNFKQRQPDLNTLGGWIWNIKGVRRVLYRLPDLLKAIADGRPVFVAEGEKDVDALVRVGFVATCNVGGAGKWKPEFSRPFKGADVVIIADKDEPGRKHAREVATSLAGVAASIKLIELPDIGNRKVKDAFNFFSAGGTAADLDELVHAAPEFNPDPTPAEAARQTAETEFEFATLLAAKLPPIKTVGEIWHVFRNGVWRPLECDTLKPAALEILPQHCRTIRRAKSLLDHIGAARQTDSAIFKGFLSFDATEAVLINASNGVVRVSANGFELLPHAADHYFTRQTVARFDPEAPAPLFNRVLREVLPDPEDRELFKLCLGNFLFPDCRFETALVCYGEAGRGKSTVADPVAAALGLDLVCRLSITQVCDPRSYHLPALRFAAVNLGTELTTADIAESGNFKTLVSGEPIEARPIYGKPFVMQSACKLWFLANSLPRFRHGTDAELRRTRFLRFDFAPPVKDVTLKTRLAGELDGVFAFMLHGLRALLALPEIPLGGTESRAVHKRFQISNDPVGAFVRARCVLSPEVRVSKEALRAAFDEFTARHELPRVCGDWFFRGLFERFTALIVTQPRVSGGRIRYVQGIQLRSTFSDE